MSTETVDIKFVTSDGVIIPTQAKVGENVLELAKRFQTPLPGACEGSLACSTCHVIVKGSDMFNLTKKNLEDSMLSEEEEDLLDMAPEVTPTSRLGCQIIVTKEMNGMTLHLPSYTRNE